jgi:Rrf2 family protein
MVDLAMHHQDGPVSLQVLAREQSIPERYLAKIIQDLRRSGIIRSVRGAHGGYSLSRAPEEITLLDIWEALEGPVCPVECLDEPEICEQEAECVTRPVWGKVRDAITDVLGAEDLAELVERYRHQVS